MTENEEVREERFKELRERLLTKNYPSYVIDQGIEKARRLKDNDINTPTTKSQTGIVAVSTHNPNNTNMGQLVQETIKVLDTSPKMRPIMENNTITFAKRQPKNLKGLLSKAAFHLDGNNNAPRITKCGHTCETCKSIKDGPTVHFKATDSTFTVKRNMNCESRNVIYLITCSGCGEQYIGETGTPLKTRMTTHRQQIRDPETRKIAVSGHIAQCGQGKFTVSPFYKMDTDSQDLRRSKEHYFINKYKPKLNAM